MATSASPARVGPEQDCRNVRVAIVGAGFGGLGAAIRLKQAGIDDFVVLERAADVGGTWQVNTYPGAQCDIPSILYSFSFAPNPRWSRLYPLQPEIHQYLHDCVDKFDIAGHLRLEHDVLDAFWDDIAQAWQVKTDKGTWQAQFLVPAMGPFSEPSIPDIPGLDRFPGTVFHTSAWNHEHDLSGKRVAVIGTGASAVQIIPRLQPHVDALTVFQRTPTWVLPHPDRPMEGMPRRVFQHVPFAQRIARTALDLVQEALVPGLVSEPALLKGLEWASKAHMYRQVRDPHLRAKLTPNYSFGCKRPTYSNSYYPALAHDNVDVVTDEISQITENGVVTAGGFEYEVDTIVLGTGFRMSDHPGFERLRGRDGRTLGEVWEGDAQAYLGTAISGFPNLFFILGPNSVTYTSQVITIEAQVNYMLSCLRAMDKRGATSIDVRPEVQREFVRKVDENLRGSVWNDGGCSSYYLNESGRNFVFYPGFNRQFRAETRAVDLDDFRVSTVDSALAAD